MNLWADSDGGLCVTGWDWLSVNHGALFTGLVKPRLKPPWLRLCQSLPRLHQDEILN